MLSYNLNDFFICCFCNINLYKILPHISKIQNFFFHKTVFINSYPKKKKVSKNIGSTFCYTLLSTFKIYL